jgi:predicted RNA-binding Zn ribbon-like protein
MTMTHQTSDTDRQSNDAPADAKDAAVHAHDAPDAEYVFDLDGGRACLDFANTRSTSGEHLNSYTDLVAFAAQSRLLTPEDASWLEAQAKRDPATAEGVLVRARRLREAMRAIFSSIAAGGSPRDADLGTLNFDLAVSLQHARVIADATQGGYQWGWSGRYLDAPVWPIARSAADLLTSDEERRLVRECGAGDCEWLFIDTTRNRSRQWCSMQSCGNREKARRHYQRQRANRAVGSATGARGSQAQAAT